MHFGSALSMQERCCSQERTRARQKSKTGRRKHTQHNMRKKYLRNIYFTSVTAHVQPFSMSLSGLFVWSIMTWQAGAWPLLVRCLFRLAAKSCAEFSMTSSSSHGSLDSLALLLDGFSAPCFEPMASVSESENSRTSKADTTMLDECIVCNAEEGRRGGGEH